MSTAGLVRELRTASRAELRQRLVEGAAVNVDALAGWAYRGTSLGLPRLVERLSWTTFQKTFHRESRDGRLVGWNVRIAQDGLGAPSRPLLRHGEPVTEWNYEVVPSTGTPVPPGLDHGVLIDYGRAKDPRLSPVHLVKDPLASLSGEDADVLLGVSYVVIGGRALETPTYFVLEREHPIAFVPAVFR